MNWGRIFGWALAGMTFACSVGYAFAHDWRRAIYFALCGAINVTVIY